VPAPDRRAGNQTSRVLVLSTAFGSAVGTAFGAIGIARWSSLRAGVLGGIACAIGFSVFTFVVIEMSTVRDRRRLQKGIVVEVSQSAGQQEMSWLPALPAAAMIVAIGAGAARPLPIELGAAGTAVLLSGAVGLVEHQRGVALRHRWFTAGRWSCS
jgi:hypothetical protein